MHNRSTTKVCSQRGFLPRLCDHRVGCSSKINKQELVFQIKQQRYVILDLEVLYFSLNFWPAVSAEGSTFFMKAQRMKQVLPRVSECQMSLLGECVFLWMYICDQVVGVWRGQKLLRKQSEDFCSVQLILVYAFLMSRVSLQTSSQFIIAVQDNYVNFTFIS